MPSPSPWRQHHNAFSDSSGGGSHLYGDILALLAAWATAVYTLIGRIARTSTSTTIYTYLVYIASAITLLLITLAQGFPLTGYGMSGIVVGLLLAIFSTILGHSIFSWCLKFLSPTFVSASKLCEPVVAAVFAAFLFHEIPPAPAGNRRSRDSRRRDFLLADRKQEQPGLLSLPLEHAR